LACDSTSNIAVFQSSTKLVVLDFRDCTSWGLVAVTGRRKMNEQNEQTAVIEKPEVNEDKKSKRQPPYNVILLNDEHHTFEYVIKMLQELFAHTPEKACELAKEVHDEGRAIVLTTTLEHAELKRDQIHAYGKDDSIKACEGSMSAVLEPAA
jgi:ATP-dependent Clp protease adaptor protein ClpS